MTTYCLGENCKFRNKSNGMCLWATGCPLGLDVDSGLAGYLGSDKQKLLTKAEQWRKGEDDGKHNVRSKGRMSLLSARLPFRNHL